jgi:hypothetical protein
MAANLRGQSSDPAYAHGDLVLDADLSSIPVTALFIGTGGDVSLNMLGTDIASNVVVTKIYKNLPSGSILPVRPNKVNSAGTTAQDIIILV